MTTTPTWSPVDDSTADLLSVLADDGTLRTEDEWNVFVRCLLIARGVCKIDGAEDGAIDPNLLRHVIGGQIKPQRVGAFTNRALRQGLVEYTGRYVVSTDTKGRNSGKPCRELKWVGTQAAVNAA